MDRFDNLLTILKKIDQDFWLRRAGDINKIGDRQMFNELLIGIDQDLNGRYEELSRIVFSKPPTIDRRPVFDPCSNLSPSLFVPADFLHAVRTTRCPLSGGYICLKNPNFLNLAPESGEKQNILPANILNQLKEIA